MQRGAMIMAGGARSIMIMTRGTACRPRNINDARVPIPGPSGRVCVAVVDAFNGVRLGGLGNRVNVNSAATTGGIQVANGCRHVVIAVAAIQSMGIRLRVHHLAIHAPTTCGILATRVYGVLATNVCATLDAANLVATSLDAANLVGALVHTIAARCGVERDVLCKCVDDAWV